MSQRAWIALTAGLGLVSLAATVPTPWRAADQVITITKAQWAAEMEKAPVEISMQNVADDYTEFNPEVPTRLDGKALVMRPSEAGNSGSGSLIAAEMTNEKVQVYGEVPVLTYNCVGMSRDKDGVTDNTLAKSTRVYVNQESQWMLVHANFAPVE